MERQEQASGGAVFWFHLKQVIAFQCGCAIGHFVTVFARQNVRQCGFTRPVWPHNRVNFTSANLQIDTFEDLLILFFKFDVEVVDLKHSIPLDVQPLLQRIKAATGGNPARR